MRDADRSDAELLQALRRETDAVGVLYDRYALRLVRYLGQEGASEEIALDVVQEVFAQLMTCIAVGFVQAPTDRSGRGWLSRVATCFVTGSDTRTIDARARRRLSCSRSTPTKPKTRWPGWTPHGSAEISGVRSPASRPNSGPRSPHACSTSSTTRRSRTPQGQARQPCVAAFPAACERCRRSSKEAIREPSTTHSPPIAETLIAAAGRWQKSRAQRRRRLVLLTSALTAARIIGSGTAIATTGWLVGSPAPPNVKSDFGGFAPQLGFNPRPGRAVLVARDGAYKLYATTNKQGGFCTSLVTPGSQPGPHGEGGDCAGPDRHSFEATAVPAGASGTLVLFGHTAAPPPRTSASQPERRIGTAKVGRGASSSLTLTSPTRSSAKRPSSRPSGGRRP